MNTSDRPAGFLPGEAPAQTLDPAALSAEIARMANQLFGAAKASAPHGPAAVAQVLPASPSQLSLPPAPLASASSFGAGGPGFSSPPNPGPAAAALGASGISTSASAPPLPGFVQTPPIASAPPLKESDLRPAVTMLSDLSGLSSPAALAPATEDASAPYFLGIAGLPAASSTALVTPIAEPGLPALAPSRGAFDPHALKRDFPILKERVHGRPLVWLDNAATTQKPNAVIERLSHFYRHENSNVHRAAHELAARATDAYEGARNTVRRFLNAPSSKDVVFVRGATEGINLVAQSWGRKNIGPGDEILITWLEHHANIVPWQMLAAEKGASLRVAPVDSTGQIILEEYERLLGPRTKLVALTQVSNALGTITPAREMVAMAHRHGARALVDGAQAVLHMPVDVQALDADFYVFSGHKVFAPTGIGIVYGKSDLLEAMPPWQGGGNMIQDVSFEKTLYQAPPWRFEAGTGNIADAAGLGAALDYVGAIGLENIQRYEHELLAYGSERLLTVPGLRLLGTAAEKAAVFSFVVEGLRTEDIGGALDQEGIAVRSGHHCAQPILRRFGVESSVRASLALYNTREDIDALVAALLRLTATRRVPLN